jgi:hypothetical protein
VRVVYLSHLDDAQRMFFVTLLLHAVVAWSRRLPGSFRAAGAGLLGRGDGLPATPPPRPAEQGPVLTLLKQARAVGVGVMLCTQNPVDMDYKAMSNANTWLIGRLATRQDRARVVDGLEDADGPALGQLIARLPPRTFLLRGDRGLASLPLPPGPGPAARTAHPTRGGSLRLSDARRARRRRCRPGLSARWLDPDLGRHAGRAAGGGAGGWLAAEAPGGGEVCAGDVAGGPRGAAGAVGGRGGSDGEDRRGEAARCGGVGGGGGVGAAGVGCRCTLRGFEATRARRSASRSVRLRPNSATSVGGSPRLAAPEPLQLPQVFCAAFAQPPLSLRQVRRPRLAWGGSQVQ